MKNNFSVKDSFEVNIYNNNDFMLPPASGSAGYKRMVIIPCSMKTLGMIANGIASNLMCRAADVILKEGGTLVVVPRETPLSVVHLENMLRLKKAGGILLPASPAFYNKPENIDELVDFVCGKVMSALGISTGIIKPWGMYE